MEGGVIRLIPSKKSMEIYGNLWLNIQKLWEIYGILWLNIQKSMGNPWKSAFFNG